MGFQNRSIQATKSLLGFSEQIREYEVRLRASGGLTEEVANKQVSLANFLDLAKNRVVNLAAAFGEQLVPSLHIALGVVGFLLDGLGLLVELFSSLPEPIQFVIVAFGALLAIAGPVLFVTGQLITAWGAFAIAMPAAAAAIGTTVSAMFGPVGLIVAGVAFLLSWEPVRTFLWDLATTVFEAVKTGVMAVVDTLTTWWNATEDIRILLVAFAGVIIDQVVEALTIAVTFWREAITVTIDWITAMVASDAVIDGFVIAINILSKSIKGLISWIIKAVKAWGQWIESMGGMIKVLNIIQPGLGTMIGGIKNWSKNVLLAHEAAKKWSDAVKNKFTTAMKEGIVVIHDCINSHSNAQAVPELQATIAPCPMTTVMRSQFGTGSHRTAAAIAPITPVVMYPIVMTSLR